VETLKKIVSNQYFPAAAVLTAVVLFWAVGLLGGLSLLNNNQPPLTTLTWMLFVYLAAVLTPLAGVLAAVDLLRRWKRNRAADAAGAYEAAGVMEAEAAGADFNVSAETVTEPVQQQPVAEQPIQQKPEQPAPQQQPARHQPVQQQPAQQKPKQQKPIQKKSGSKKAA
jgi:outer membrane biosynthesis protein TonB